MEDDKKITKERKELLELYQKKKSFLSPEVLNKSRKLDQLIVSYIKSKKKQ